MTVHRHTVTGHDFAKVRPRKRARVDGAAQPVPEGSFASVGSVLSGASIGAANQAPPKMTPSQRQIFENWDDLTSSIAEILAQLKPSPEDPYPINNLMHELLQALDHKKQAEGIHMLSAVLDEDSDVPCSGQWICVSQLCGEGRVVAVDPTECQYCKVHHRKLCFRICLYPNGSASYIRLLRLTD